MLYAELVPLILIYIWFRMVGLWLIAGIHQIILKLRKLRKNRKKVFGGANLLPHGSGEKRKKTSIEASINCGKAFLNID